MEPNVATESNLGGCALELAWKHYLTAKAILQETALIIVLSEDQDENMNKHVASLSQTSLQWYTDTPN